MLPQRDCPALAAAATCSVRILYKEVSPPEGPLVEGPVEDTPAVCCAWAFSILPHRDRPAEAADATCSVRFSYREVSGGLVEPDGDEACPAICCALAFSMSPQRDRPADAAAATCPVRFSYNSVPEAPLLAGVLGYAGWADDTESIEATCWAFAFSMGPQRDFPAAAAEATWLVRLS